MVSLDNLKTAINAIKCLLTDYPKKKDIPTKLPNPNSLTFTGAVTGSYDGSEALTVEIPSGSGSAVELDTTLSEAGKAADAKAVGDALAGYQPKGDYLTQNELQGATDAALAQAKASGEFDGQQGPEGPQGPQGPSGKDGANGAPGKDGTSATHSWNGTVLTITSASGTSSVDLKGDKGDKGDTGAQGPKGDTGATGPKGDKGDTGPAGQSAYAAAQAGGYTDTQANFYTDLAAVQGLASALAAI